MKNHNLKPFAKSERTVDRNAGTPQKTPKNFKEAILLVAESLGEDGKGKDGLVGHLRRMAKKHPQSFAALLSHLPSQTATVPVGKVVYQTSDEAAAALRAKGITTAMVAEIMLMEASEKERAEFRKTLDRHSREN